MSERRCDQVLQVLRDELAVPERAIQLAWQRCHQMPHLLPMALWQYGLITLNELEQSLDRLGEVSGA